MWCQHWEPQNSPIMQTAASRAPTSNITFVSLVATKLGMAGIEWTPSVSLVKNDPCCMCWSGSFCAWQQCYLKCWADPHLPQQKHVSPRNPVNNLTSYVTQHIEEYHSDSQGKPSGAFTTEKRMLGLVQEHGRGWCRSTAGDGVGAWVGLGRWLSG